MALAASHSGNEANSEASPSATISAINSPMSSHHSTFTPKLTSVVAANPAPLPTALDRQKAAIHLTTTNAPKAPIAMTPRQTST